MTKTGWEGRIFFILDFRSEPITEQNQERRSRQELGAETTREFLARLLSLACSTTFLIKPGPTCTGLVTFTSVAKEDNCSRIQSPASVIREVLQLRFSLQDDAKLAKKTNEYSASGILNETSDQSWHVNVWSPVCGTVWVGLGDVALLEDMCQWGWGLV